MISRRVAGLCTLGFVLILLGTYHPAVRVHLPSLSESLVQGDRDATLGVFSDIYVVSLPTRTDRRASMEQIRQTLGLRWTYLDALPSQDPLVDHIGTCVRSLRDQTAPGTIQWPSEGELERLNLDRDFRLRGAASPAAELPLAFCPAHGAPTPSTDPLTCADDDNTHGVEYSELVMDHHLLTTPKFACWYSHLSAILRYVRTGTGPAALILEDDVDMERDIRPRLEDLWETLPEDWDIVYLGHCWSDEASNPALQPKNRTSPVPPKNALHPSHMPQCTHAYAVSHRGARRILAHLLHPSFAFSRAVDQALAWLVLSHRLRSYSVMPPIIIQAKLTGSDIDKGADGRGSAWRETLEDGVLTGVGA